MPNSHVPLKAENTFRSGLTLVSFLILISQQNRGLSSLPRSVTRNYAYSLFKTSEEYSLKIQYLYFKSLNAVTLKKWDKNKCTYYRVLALDLWQHYRGWDERVQGGWGWRGGEWKGWRVWWGRIYWMYSVWRSRDVGVHGKPSQEDTRGVHQKGIIMLN